MANLHKESFALMWYECSCGARLRAWNSRDGVTPFGINCSSCGGVMRHVDWNRDERSYTHKPFPGQVVFRDLIRRDAEEIAHRQLRARGIDPMDHERLEELIESIYGDGKSPKVTYHQERPGSSFSDGLAVAALICEYHSEHTFGSIAEEIHEHVINERRAKEFRQLMDPAHLPKLVELMRVADVEEARKLAAKLLRSNRPDPKKGCSRPLAPGQYWGFCGETDMGQSLPALCTECGGQYQLRKD